MAIPLKLVSSSSSSFPTTARGSSEEGLANKLWIKFRRESIFAMYKLAEECADDDDAKLAITKLRKGVLEELKMPIHLYRLDIEVSFFCLHFLFLLKIAFQSRLLECLGENSSFNEYPSKEETINSATVRYTDFLLATASGKVKGVEGPGKHATPFVRTKVAAYTLGAMTPCMRLYAFLAKEFQALVDSEDGSHPYKKWIDNYSSEGIEASALQTEDLLDNLSIPLTSEKHDIIEKLYHQAMKLEIEFFNVQPLSQPTVVPLTKEHKPVEDRLVKFSDFDLTCTIFYSSAILAEIAIVMAPKSDQAQPENQIARMSSAELRKAWVLLSGQYTEEYEQCIESILPSEKHLDNITYISFELFCVFAVEFNYEVLCKALEQLSDFERKENARVVESGVLKGLNLEDIKRAGERLILQDGCTSFFQKIVKNENLNANIHVVSYCWCADLIRSAFSSEKQGHGQRIDKKPHSHSSLFLHVKSSRSMNENKKRVSGKRCFRSGNSNEDEHKKKKLLKRPRPDRINFANFGLKTPTDMLEEWWHKIQAKGGIDVKLVIMKQMFATDLNTHHDRFSIPFKQIRDFSFLAEDEKRKLKEPKEKIPVTLMEPCGSKS
ncbi:hypothetical protein GH714_001139 [Hevea brasiliensis]|uniref:Thiaminase-2/PQQC domain-containing protein n=1 Tax=Hevea brasiliensis TaxID=3981 RepID=A0A6A6KH79_HEVBR|nr:hypothetical protein GH714_001139 [Hevea brasiliensis]